MLILFQIRHVQLVFTFSTHVKDYDTIFLTETSNYMIVGSSSLFFDLKFYEGPSHIVSAPRLKLLMMLEKEYERYILLMMMHCITSYLRNICVNMIKLMIFNFLKWRN